MFNRIQTLKQAYTTANEWRSVVNENDQNDMCTANDIYNIKQKSQYLAIALKLALD